MYYATNIEKTTCRDHKDTGCETKHTCTMFENIDVGADTLHDLLSKLQETYGSEHSYWDDDPQTDGFISFCQHENGASKPLSNEQLKHHFEKGFAVYICDYSFAVEYRTTRDATTNELRNAVNSIQALC